MSRLRTLQISSCAMLASSLLFANAPTREEKDLIRMAQEHRHHGIREVVDDVKRGWQVIEYFLKDVRMNNRVHAALSEKWQRMYSYNDSSVYLKITDEDIVSIFEQMLLELQPTISYFSKQREISKVRHEARAFARDVQSEYRPTVEKAQRLIMSNLKEHIPEKMRHDISECTERVCKDGIRFMLYQILLKHNNGFNRYDVRFINAKLEMLLAQWQRDYPYCCVSTYESWAFAILQDLLFAECAVCMDHKADRYMSCCKTKSICRSCYHRVSSCPLCRAPKRQRTRS
jgi:hypothetical protein